MKRISVLVCMALTAVILAGCGSKAQEANRASTTAGVAQVLGEFDSYKDGEYRYFTLRNADLVG